jgi:predicted nucleic acid-binding protein
VAEVDAPSIVVCDAGPLIHLDELGCLDLLSAFRQVFVPNGVWHEVARHRPSALRRRRVPLRRVSVSFDATRNLAELAYTLALAAGETEALVLMAELPDAVLLTDDAAARLAAGVLGYAAHGTIGVIVQAMQRKQRTKRQVLNLLRSIRRKSTLHISVPLLNSVIEQVAAS